VHPSYALLFEWDEGNERELAAHRVMAEEVEQVFWHDHPLWLPNKKGRSAAWMMIGRTLGGRLLTIGVLVKDDGETLRAITGWDADEGERTQYLRKRRR